jgi:hypothetical protein
LRIPGFGHGPSIRVLHPRTVTFHPRTLNQGPSSGRAGVRAFHSPLRGGHLPAAADLITFQRRAPSIGEHLPADCGRGLRGGDCGSAGCGAGSDGDCGAGRGFRGGWLRAAMAERDGRTRCVDAYSPHIRARMERNRGVLACGVLACGGFGAVDGVRGWKGIAACSRADGKESRRARVRRARVRWMAAADGKNRGVLARGWKGIAACSRAADLARRMAAADGKNRGVLARGGKRIAACSRRAEQGCAGAMRPRGRRRDLRAELARRQPIAGDRTGAVHAYTNLI